MPKYKVTRPARDEIIEAAFYAVEECGAITFHGPRRRDGQPLAGVGMVRTLAPGTWYDVQPVEE